MGRYPRVVISDIPQLVRESPVGRKLWVRAPLSDLGVIMLHHRTTDPAKRAEHITNRLESEEYYNSLRMSNYNFMWFETWLKIYPGILQELAGHNTSPQNNPPAKGP